MSQWNSGLCLGGDSPTESPCHYRRDEFKPIGRGVITWANANSVDGLNLSCSQFPGSSFFPVNTNGGQYVVGTLGGGFTTYGATIPIRDWEYTKFAFRIRGWCELGAEHLPDGAADFISINAFPPVPPRFDPPGGWNYPMRFVIRHPGDTKESDWPNPFGNSNPQPYQYFPANIGTSDKLNAINRIVVITFPTWYLLSLPNSPAAVNSHFYFSEAPVFAFRNEVTSPSNPGSTRDRGSGRFGNTGSAGVDGDPSISWAWMIKNVGKFNNIPGFNPTNPTIENIQALEYIPYDYEPADKWEPPSFIDIDPPFEV